MNVWYVHHEDDQWSFYICIYIMIVSVSAFILSVFTEPGVLPPLLDLRRVSGLRENTMSLLEKQVQNEIQEIFPSS